MTAPGDRDLLHMAFFDGATSEELAQRLHEPAARIRKRKARALERLRRAFIGAQRHTPALSPTSVNTSHALSNAAGLG